MCSQCKRVFPKRLLHPLLLGKEVITKCCPICALRITNKYHGINRKSFTGTQAQEYLEEAMLLYPSSVEHSEEGGHV